MQHDGQEGAVHLDVAVVLDESKLAKLVHEEIHPRARRADDPRQQLLRHLRNTHRLIGLTVSRQEEEDASESLFARVEQLVDEVFLHADVPRQHVREEAFGQRRFRVQHFEHLRLFDHQDLARAHRRGRRDAPRLTRQTALSEKVPLTEDGDDGLFSGSRQDRQPDRALLDIEDIGGLIALRKDDGRSCVLADRARDAGRIEEALQVEGRQIPRWFLQVETQPEVGVEAYDAGAKILYDFFRQQLGKFEHPELTKLGREIIQCCLSNGTVEQYEQLLPPQ